MFGYQPIKIALKCAGGLNANMHVGLAYEYRLTLHLPFSNKKSDISYFLSDEISKSRKLSDFETKLLIQKVRAVTPMFPSDDGAIHMMTDVPSLQLIIKSKGFKFDITIDGDFYDPPESVSELIELIEDIEPIDFDGLGVKPIFLP